jgi:hypothetical protein
LTRSEARGISHVPTKAQTTIAIVHMQLRPYIA